MYSNNPSYYTPYSRDTPQVKNSPILRPGSLPPQSLPGERTVAMSVVPSGQGPPPLLPFPVSLQPGPSNRKILRGSPASEYAIFFENSRPPPLPPNKPPVNGVELAINVPPIPEKPTRRLTSPADLPGKPSVFQDPPVRVHRHTLHDAPQRPPVPPLPPPPIPPIPPAPTLSLPPSPSSTLSNDKIASSSRVSDQSHDTLSEFSWMTLEDEDMRVARQIYEDEKLARKLAKEDALAAEEELKRMAMEANLALPALPTPPVPPSLPTPPMVPPPRPLSSASNTRPGSERGSSQISRSRLPRVASTNSLPAVKVTPMNAGVELEDIVSSPSDLTPSLQISDNTISILPKGSRSPAPIDLVDRSLLMGFDLGFHAPAISLDPRSYQGGIPNLIQLPYGRSSPFHIQSHSWRSLLKLLVQLSGSRIEPRAEAVVATGEVRLRTVIQFIRVHQSSSSWNVILYLTADYPIPSSQPNYFKYTNGDVNTLPFSYSLSSLPTLLRDISDSEIARTYTVPSTESTPYPRLPIDLPKLAMYLQAALGDSRRAINDSSSGLRKLARMVDGLSPEDHSSVVDVRGPEAGDSRKAPGFVERIIRIGRTPKEQRRGVNADTYDLITPFRLDSLP